MNKLFTAIVLLMILSACGDEVPTPAENDTQEDAQENGAQDEVQEDINWENQISEIASSDRSETEKHDEVMLELVSNFEPTEDEIKEFETYLVSEFESGNYLGDITDHEYMLSNIFKSGVVEKYDDDADQNPVDSFAFDFLQNTKYTYRGAESVDSESVQSNEEQMKKALEEVE